MENDGHLQRKIQPWTPLLHPEGVYPCSLTAGATPDYMTREPISNDELPDGLRNPGERSGHPAILTQHPAVFILTPHLNQAPRWRAETATRSHACSAVEQLLLL